MVKNPFANAGDVGSVSGLRGCPVRRKWLLTPVFLPGESHGRGAWRATIHWIAKSRISTMEKNEGP